MKKVDSLKFMINSSFVKNITLLIFNTNQNILLKKLAKGPNLSESNAKTAEGLKIQRTELERLRDVIGSQIITYNTFRTKY
jgi:hypothetical protein